jgi:hypothetical protein
MDKDRAKKELVFSRDEWQALGRRLVRNVDSYRVPFSLAPSLAQDAIFARDRFLGRDESQFPAGHMRSQAIDEKQKGIRITSDILDQLSEFLPREVSFGDQVENDLRNLNS